MLYFTFHFLCSISRILDYKYQNNKKQNKKTTERLQLGEIIHTALGATGTQTDCPLKPTAHNLWSIKLNFKELEEEWGRGDIKGESKNVLPDSTLTSPSLRCACAA